MQDQQVGRFSLYPVCGSDPTEGVDGIDLRTDQYPGGWFSALELGFTGKQESGILQGERDNGSFMTCFLQVAAQGGIEVGDTTPEGVTRTDTKDLQDSMFIFSSTR
jgi:hypothetical protein